MAFALCLCLCLVTNETDLLALHVYTYAQGVLGGQRRVHPPRRLCGPRGGGEKMRLTCIEGIRPAPIHISKMTGRLSGRSIA